MTKAQQRDKVCAEVVRRMAGSDAIERLTDLVCEWRDLALHHATAHLRQPQAPPVGMQDDGTP